MAGIRAVLADEQRLYTEALKCLLAKHFDDIQVVDVAHDGPTLMDQASIYQPDLFIVNVKLPVVDGLTLIPDLKQVCPDSTIVVISEYDHPKFIKTAFQGGADGYLLKTNSVEELSSCLTTTMNGSTFMGQGVSIGSLSRKSNTNYETDWDIEDAFMVKSNLTKRELEILACIANAKNNKEIAQELFISDQTVGVHRKNIMKKMNVSSTASLIKMAHEFGIIN